VSGPSGLGRQIQGDVDEHAFLTADHAASSGFLEQGRVAG
jgi:hypothetical protein